jgi:hypothetical protein
MEADETALEKFSWFVFLAKELGYTETNPIFSLV